MVPLVTQLFSEFFPEWKHGVVLVQHKGKPCLLNRGCRPGERHPYLPAKPEEYVRQGFIAYLLDRLGIPLYRIRIEKGIHSLSVSGEAKGRGRFDLVIFDGDRPLVLIEFKRESETESLIQTAYRQAKEYARGVAEITYVLLCNGRTSRLFDTRAGDLKFLDGCDIAPEIAHLAQLTAVSINQQEPVVFDKKYFDTEASREQEWAVEYLVALQNFLISQSLLKEETNLFKVIKDFGADWGHLRNAGGKHTKGVRGLFHFYEIEFANGDRDIMGITIAKYDPAAPGQRTSNIMTVGLGSKSMLEMQTSSRFIQRSDGHVTLSHNGKMTAVNGYRRHDALREYARCIPDLVDDAGERIVFGRFPDTCQIEGVEWKQIVLNIARYAIERERVEEQFRRIGRIAPKSLLQKQGEADLLVE